MGRFKEIQAIIFISVTNLYKTNMLSAKISREFINSGIPSISIL